MAAQPTRERLGKVINFVGHAAKGILDAERKKDTNSSTGPENIGKTAHQCFFFNIFIFLTTGLFQTKEVWLQLKGKCTQETKNRNMDL